MLRAELSTLISRELKDPRVGGLVSVTDVETTSDLRHARVFISVFGTADEQAATLTALRAASGFLRREIAHRIVLRHTPDLEFRLDSSIERGTHMMQLIREVSEADRPKPPPRRRTRSARADS